MSEKKILLAGGAGFIGTRLSEHFLEKGLDFDVIDIGWFGNYLPKGVTYIEKNLFSLTQQDLEKYHTVIFLAGLSNDPMAEYSPAQNFVFNAALPSYLGFMAREAGVERFIFASSCSVYGYTHNSTFTEEDEVVCNYPYGVSKLQGERSLLALAGETFKVICLRQGTVCGFSNRMRLDLAMNTMLKNALTKNEIQLSNAKIWRPILGLHDLCQAYEKVVLKPELETGVYNIASFNATVAMLANDIKDILEKRNGLQIQIVDRKIQDYRNYKVSWQKAADSFGYQPSQTPAGIVGDLLDSLEVYKDFDNKKYYNIEVFKDLKHGDNAEGSWA